MRRGLGPSSPGRRRGNASLISQLAPFIGIAAIIGGFVLVSSMLEPAPQDLAGAQIKAPLAAPTVPGNTGKKAAAEANTPVPPGAGGVDRRDKRDVKRLKRLASTIAANGISSTQPATFRVGTFNILGTQHTAPGGTKGPSWPSGAARLPGTIERIKAHGVSVVGLQELQPDQAAGLVNGTGFAIYPGADVRSTDRVNSIMYDAKVWEFVSGTTFSMSNGKGFRAQPVIRLKHIESQQEVYFVNAHPPAGGGSIVGKRMGAFDKIVSVVNQLKKDGIPIILTGDMNDRAAFFCRVLPPTGMNAAVGGSSSGGCQPPGQMAVDWVVGTSDVTWSDYFRDTSPPKRKLSDHMYISATATVGGDG